MHVSLLFSWAKTFWYYRDVAFKKADKNIRVTPWGIEKKIKEVKVEKKVMKTWLLTFPKRLITHKTSSRPLHAFDTLQ